jgi:hypothetical protein
LTNAVTVSSTVQGASTIEQRYYHITIDSYMQNYPMSITLTPTNSDKSPFLYAAPLTSNPGPKKYGSSSVVLVLDMLTSSVQSHLRGMLCFHSAMFRSEQPSGAQIIRLSAPEVGKLNNLYISVIAQTTQSVGYSLLVLNPDQARMLRVPRQIVALNSAVLTDGQCAVATKLTLGSPYYATVTNNAYSYFGTLIVHCC